MSGHRDSELKHTEGATCNMVTGQVGAFQGNV